jgi:hypothetical protein
VQRTRVIAFEKIIALFEIDKPYTNHNETPKVKMLYIPRDKDSVSLVFNVKNAWGKNEAVVSIAAI